MGVSFIICLLLSVFSVDMKMNGGLNLMDTNNTKMPQNTFIKVYNLSTCFQNQTRQEVTINVKNGNVNYQKLEQSSFGKCKIIFPVSTQNMLLFQIDKCKAVRSRLSDYDTNFTRNNPFLSQCVYPYIYNVKDTVIIEETVGYVPAFIVGMSNLSTYFPADSEFQKHPHLEVIYLTKSSGYIQTPGWNGRNPYPSYMKNCIMLTSPPDYVIFFSFFSMKINYGDKLKRFIGHCDSTKVLTGTHGYEPFLFPEKNIQRRNRDTYLSLHFISWSNRGLDTGFRLRFSFHPETLKPERLPTLLPGETTWRWNCTESVWPDLANHFMCDLAPQCVDSEDEARCPYTTEKCGLHKMEIAERCYVFIPDSGRLSWLEADRECRANGGLLASLETQQEFEAVSSVIRPFTSRGIRIGLTSTRLGGKKASLNPMYTNTLHWESGSVVFSLLYVTQGGSEPCGVLSEWKTKHRYLFTPCNNPVHAAAVCELPSVSDPPTGTRQPPRLPLLNTTSVSRVALMACPLQHLTHELLFCDQKSLCQSLEKGGHWFKTACNVPATGLRQPYFSCGILEDFVPFSLVCDFRVDCVSGRDEDFCVYPACQGNTRNCGNGQCVAIDKYCNGYKDCLTNVDEVQCPFGFHIISTVSLPAMVNFDKPRGFTVTPLPKDNAQCPATHFQCHDDGFCLPVYARCNNVNDCPGHEDESECQDYRCPGFYRCRSNERTVCVHVDHLCDGLQQCPLLDDELMCDTATCPESCTCSGLAFTCADIFLVRSFPELRYLEARHTGLHQSEVTNNTMLIHLGVQACGWRELIDIMLPNLHSLDLSDNLLQSISFSFLLVGTPHLQRLSLSGNPLTASLSVTPSEVRLLALESFSLSQVKVTVLDLTALSAIMPNLKSLNLSGSKIRSLQGRHHFESLRVLDLQGCPISDFTPDFMKSMASLTRVCAENFHLCCPAILPDHFTGQCLAPSDDVSSCDDLLKSTPYRCALAVFAVFSLLGNFSSFVYRVCFSKESASTGFVVFVLHLCISDFLMGVYLGFIGIADLVYAGIYLWKEAAWKSSPVCSSAGFLSFLSSEASAFIICLITVDRFLVLHFPFSHIRFGARSAQVACSIVWILGLTLATVPLLPVASHWAFYQQTGICIPLPITKADFAGHTYSFSVMIICNLVVFLLIAVGQTLIYWSVTSNAISNQISETNNKRDGRKSKEAVIARRLLTIAVSDFMCWFPIGLCGLLAANHVLIPVEVNVALAIFILPLNSAINPFLYTLNVIQEKRRRAQERRHLQILRALQKN